MEIGQFLNWMLGSGGSVIAASWILEQIAWFQKLEAEAKKWTFFGVASLLALLVLAVQTFVPTAMLEAFAPWFAVVSGVFLSVMMGNGFHKVTK